MNAHIRILFIGFVMTTMLSGCASIVADENNSVTFSFSDNSKGECQVMNKRIDMKIDVPGSHLIRRSDDLLHYDCTTEDGREAKGSVESEIEGTIAGNIIFGGVIGAVVDANTDKHRKYPDSIVIPVVAK